MRDHIKHFEINNDYIHWVQEDIFFLIDSDGSTRIEAASTRREPYQTVRTVYFILGILRTDPGARVQRLKRRLEHSFRIVKQLPFHFAPQ